MSESRLLLALETACGVPAVALLRGDAVVAEAAGPAGSRGAEQLLPCIDGVLREAGVALADVEAFAVSVGPGSFTGLRVGVATLKGLAFGDARPVVAVSTLEAVARAAERRDRPVVAVLDAQRGELYAAGFAWGEAGCAPCAPGEGVYRPEELVALLPDGAVATGPASARVAAGGGAVAEARVPLVAAVGCIGQGAVSAGTVTRADALVPRYVRRAEAEVQRTGERFE